MDVTLEQLASALTKALNDVLDEDEFDIALSVGGETRELDINTDDWTIHLEGWPETIGWFAIDDEPDDESGYSAARRNVMPDSVELALAAVDRELNGALSQALTASNDPFTMSLVTAIS